MQTKTNSFLSHFLSCRLCERSEAIQSYTNTVGTKPLQQKLCKDRCFFTTLVIPLLQVLTLVLFAFTTSLYWSATTLAASYSVSPLVIDRELEKRDSITETITLKNNSEQLIRVYPTVNEVSKEEGSSVQRFLEPSMVIDRASSITTWIEIGRGRIELKPQESKEVTLTIRVNPEVEAGEYHAFIGFPEGSNRPEAEKVVYTGSAPGTILRIGVDKVQNEFLRLTSFKTERFVKTASEGEILIALTNSGDSPVVPAGEVIFYDKRGNEVGAVPVNEQKVSIAQGTEARLALFIPNTLSMGKYKAFLSLEYGDTIKTSINDTAFFYVMPIKQLLFIFLVIAVLTSLMALYVHKRYNGEVHDDSVNDVGLYVRSTKSEPKDHDIDLSKKNEPTI